MIQERLIKLLPRLEDISIGHYGIDFFKPDDIEGNQQGYSFGENLESLITAKKGDWEAGWIVIGTDTVFGDPIIADTNSK